MQCSNWKIALFVGLHKILCFQCLRWWILQWPHFSVVLWSVHCCHCPGFWMPNLGCPELDFHGWWRSLAGKSCAFPTAWRSWQAKPPQAGKPFPKRSAAQTGLSTWLPSSAHQLSFPFKKPGLHWEPAVPPTAVTAPWLWGTVTPQPCSAQGSRGAQAQGAVLGPRTQKGFVQSQTAVPLGETLFPDGHQGWPVNLPSKENGGFLLS